MKILAPLSGLIIPIEQVPDPVFAQKMVGDGLAIDPISNVLCAPCAGVISHLHPAKHAITLMHQNGTEILMHIGIDTVKLKGEGFHVKVQSGDAVHAGQPLIEFDADRIADQAKSLVTLIIATGDHSLKKTSRSQVQVGKDELFTVESEQGPRSPTPAAAHAEHFNSAPVRVLLGTGLHARPAAVLVSMAKSYASELQMIKGERTANAKSVVSLMSLEIAYGDSVTIRAVGPDARQAAIEMAELLQDLRESETHTPAPPAQVRAKMNNDPTLILGVGISPGLAIGRVHQIRGHQFEIPEKSGARPAEEKSRLNAAIAQGVRELTALMADVKARTDAAQAAIFTAHLELLQDPDLVQMALSSIDQGKSAAFSWNQATETHAGRLSALKNELLANRANDLRDVGQRILRILLPGAKTQSIELQADTILIAENLTPSETVQLDRSKIVAFCTTTGGATSHVAILARSLGLPALAGADPKVLELREGSEIILDGEAGEIRLQPSTAQKQHVLRAQREQLERRKAALSLAHQPALTRDGQRIEVSANIGNAADARQAVELGADGVGLLRSEFLFLERDTAPSEDEQLRVYQEIAEILGDRPLVIRTLDVGGDKPLKYLPMPAEENPFLGVRGVRIGLRYPEILRTQLRAILRVRSRADLHVMFPMIATLEEFREARAMLEDERAKLQAAPVKVGIMVEVPSAALMAESFAKEVDFLSIGTNDLTQYVMAMDRGHKDLAKQVDALHPSVLKMIALTAQAGRKYGKWVGVCGGLASDLPAVPILLGLGVTELSVSLPSIPLVKSHVRETALPETQALAQQALLAESAAEVRKLEKKSIEHLNTWQGLNHVDRENVVLVPTENR